MGKKPNNDDKQKEDIITEDQENKETETEIFEESQTQELQKQIDELNDKYLRLVAEYDNFRKRTLKERDSIYPQAQAETIAKFLPVLDSFERALEFEPASEDFAKGIKLIDQNFKDILSGFCIQEVGEIGEEFDPNLHNAVMHIEDPDLGKNVIAQVFEKGYKIGDRIIRYATVQTAN